MLREHRLYQARLGAAVLQFQRRADSGRLRRMGVVLKQAQYFITCRGFARGASGARRRGPGADPAALIDPNVFSERGRAVEHVLPAHINGQAGGAGRARPARHRNWCGRRRCNVWPWRCDPHARKYKPMWSTSTTATSGKLPLRVFESFAQHRDPLRGLDAGRRRHPLPVQRHTDHERPGMSLRALAESWGGDRSTLSRRTSSPAGDRNCSCIQFLHLAFALGPEHRQAGGATDRGPLYEMKPRLGRWTSFRALSALRNTTGCWGGHPPEHYILPISARR